MAARVVGSETAPHFVISVLGGGLPRQKVACPLTSGSCETGRTDILSRRRGPARRPRRAARGAQELGRWECEAGTDIESRHPGELRLRVKTPQQPRRNMQIRARKPRSSTMIMIFTVS